MKALLALCLILGSPTGSVRAEIVSLPIRETDFAHSGLPATDPADSAVGADRIARQSDGPAAFSLTPATLVALFSGLVVVWFVASARRTRKREISIFD